eukprot:TRINITY_DN9248_c0_g1_i1.p1 TRINITY_DN9248_c0_g1~~TRINITY_DN9248_c0_g1_i1.p1  ORF type:complete len:610 (+),score=112.75 TRINITY_DN9248_c0_g1_i1:597-2426(+)
MASTPLGLLREYTQKTILQIFDGSSVSVLCIDAVMKGLLTIALNTTDLKEALGVNSLVLVEEPEFSLEADSHEGMVEGLGPGSKIVVMISNKMSTLKATTDLVKLIKEGETSKRRTEITVHISPRNTTTADFIFNSEGIDKHLKEVVDLDVDIVPRNDDFLSMERSDCFRELYIENDISSLYSIAKAILKLQLFTGPISKIRRIGPHASTTDTILSQMLSETTDIFASQPVGIDTLFLIDRGCDLVTPVLYGRTYHGFLLELYPELLNNLGDFKPDFAIDDAPKEMKLTGEIFDSLKDLNFFHVKGEILDTSAAIKEKKSHIKKDKHKMTTKELATMTHQLRSDLDLEPQLMFHWNVEEVLRKKTEKPEFIDLKDIELHLIKGTTPEESSITEMIETLLFGNYPYTSLLRIICLYSHCNGGLGKHHETWKVLIVKQYGVKALFQWNNLQKCGCLITTEKKPKTSKFHMVRDMLQLWDGAFNSQRVQRSMVRSPAHNTHNGFSPAIPALIESVTTAPDYQRKWSSHCDGVFKHLPPPVSPQKDSPSDLSDRDKPRVVLLFFIGGITLSEISAIRNLKAHIDKKDLPQVSFLIASTSIVTGSSFIESVIRV